MTDLLNIAKSGVGVAQSQLNTTSHNIANLNTEGYHRQTVIQATHKSDRIGNSYYGNGAYVSDVKRIYDSYAQRELGFSQSELSYALTTSDKLSQLDQLFSNVGSLSVTGGLSDLFSSLSSLSDVPDDLELRSNVLNTAKQLANSLNQLQDSLDNRFNSTNSEIKKTVERINAISNELADVNKSIMSNANGYNDDNQLLDKQDSLIQELSQYGTVNVIPLENGGKSVMFGGQTMLVSGEIPLQLKIIPGDPKTNQTQLSIIQPSGSEVKVNGNKVGGQLGAYFNTRDYDLLPAADKLGKLALGIADNFNTLQSQGFDLNGAVGSNIFTDINDPSMQIGRVGAFGKNTGNASLTVNIDSANKLSGDSYNLVFDGTNYTLTNSKTQTSEVLTDDGLGNFTSADGFTISLKAGTLPNAGDTFGIRPTSSAARRINVEMTDPHGIAASGPTITASSNNAFDFTLTGSIAPGADTVNTYSYVVNPSTNTFDILDVNGATLSSGNPYTNNQITANGYTFQLGQSIADGDSFTVDPTVSEGNNNNSLRMAKLNETSVMDNGATTLSGVYQGITLDIGSKTKNANTNLDTAQAIYNQASDRVLSTSGVNLDEEASNLIRYQQAYQASARVMTTAKEIFDTLLGSVRG